MSGRNQNGILVNNSSSQQAKLFVNAYRTNFTYPAWFENTLGFAESGQITVLELQRAADNLLNQGLMKPKPSFQTFTGNQKQAIDQRIRNMYGDDIELLHSNVSGLGDAMDAAKLHRDSNAAKIEALNPKISQLHEKHRDQETRISRNAEMIGKKADKGHKHKGGGEECDCAFWDLPCHAKCSIDEGFEGLGKLALIGGVALVGIWLLKMRLGK